MVSAEDLRQASAEGSWQASAEGFRKNIRRGLFLPSFGVLPFLGLFKRTLVLPWHNRRRDEHGRRQFRVLGFRVKLLHRSRFASKGWFLPSTLLPIRPRSFHILAISFFVMLRSAFSSGGLTHISFHDFLFVGLWSVFCGLWSAFSRFMNGFFWVYGLPFVGLWSASSGFMVCLFWVHGLPFLGSWSASFGFMVCLLWVYGLPFLGLWSAFCGFMVCLFWVYGLPFVGSWSAFCGLMVCFWVYGLPFLIFGFVWPLVGSRKVPRRLPESFQKAPRKKNRKRIHRQNGFGV